VVNGPSMKMYLYPLESLVQTFKDLVATHRIVWVGGGKFLWGRSPDRALASPVDRRKVGEQLIRQAREQPIDRLQLLVGPLKVCWADKIVDEH
jgi:hypothetical protein